jgi:chromosome partitioning protein
MFSCPNGERRATIKGVTLAPALSTLGGVGVALAAELSRDTRLRSALGAVDDRFDLVVIDSPPTAGTLSVNAAVAASELLIPVEPCALAVAGLVGLESLAEEIREAYSPGLRLAGIVLSKVPRTATARAIEAELRARYGDVVLRTTIPHTASIPAAHARAASVLDDPKSPAAAAFRAVAQELDHGAEQRTQEGRRRNRSGVGDSGAPGHAA